MMISKIDLFYHGLNLDCPKQNNYVNQTNTTVSEIMNDFIIKYKNDFKNKNFILFYNDDIYSLIAYQMLKNIQGIFPFTLKIYGKRKKTKKFISKKDFLTFFSKKSNIKNAIYISCFNPIYKVKNSNISFKELSNNNCYSIINKFTPKQFRILSFFYNIDNAELLRELTMPEILDFDVLVTHGIANFNLEKEEQKYLKYHDFYNEIINKITEIDLIKFEGNKNDFTIFDKILKNCETKMCYYFYNEEKYQFLIENLNPYINSVNAINKNNSNINIKLNDICNGKLQYNFIGDWTEEEKLKFWR